MELRARGVQVRRRRPVRGRPPVRGCLGGDRAEGTGVARFPAIAALGHGVRPRDVEGGAAEGALDQHVRAGYHARAVGSSSDGIVRRHRTRTVSRDHPRPCAQEDARGPASRRGLSPKFRLKHRAPDDTRDACPRTGGHGDVPRCPQVLLFARST
ncbi:Hypothetical protein CAP_8830 [Chondromyces apiculatus DSM 436]|uniref:Uncharacterized protein n=1 Tax=Chondromyces apiculatus DSM 436 TaxID=1192034 RepID=A0A017SW24_9BACT|nr:Hypothetical protein CAP_8830 [Chondromyces apiculatus DSM 436]